MPSPSPRPPRRSTGTVIVAVALVVALGISGVGLAGWAAWGLLRDGRGADGLVTPPRPSADAQDPVYPAELAKYYEQDLDWRRCGGDQCSRLNVPLDYAKPGGTSIELSVVRVPASARGERVGQLVVNPGGPGASGLDYAQAGVDAFGPRLSRYFDIVGFDPRGVGESTPLKCLDTAQTDAFLSADPDPDTPAEVRRLDRLTRKFGDGCLANSDDLARHMGTVAAAKDMDILREALGEPRLDFLGASYGTFLGATYADLFPDHVRRMVLDGAVDPAKSNEELSLGQAAGFETALSSYLRRCVDRGHCFLGDTVEAARLRITQLLDQLDANPLPTSGGRPLTEGLGVFGLIYPLYVESFWPLLTDALKQAIEEGNGDGLIQLSDRYTSRGLNGYTNNAIPALYAVNCLDRDEIIPSSAVPKYLARFDKASPTFGRTFAYGLSACADWPVHSGRRSSALHAKGAPPIVVVGTTRDPATPYEQAVALADQLDSGVLVSRDGDGHTGFGMGNHCVDRAVEDYLIGGKVPKDGLSC